MTYPDLPLTCGSVHAEAPCYVHAQSARTFQPGATPGTPLAVPPMNARPSAHQLVETRSGVRSTAPTVRLDHGCRVGRSRRDQQVALASGRSPESILDGLRFGRRAGAIASGHRIDSFVALRPKAFGRGEIQGLDRLGSPSWVTAH